MDASALGALLGPWNPTPVAIDGGIMGVADRVCRTIHGESLWAYELQIVDARGAAILNAFYVGMAGGNFACENLLIDSFGQLHADGFGSGTDPSEGIPRPRPNEVIAWYGTHQEAPRSMITSAGLVGSNVAEVRFTADGKPDIVATVMNGWFAAWLPDEWARLTLRGYDADGVEVFATLDW